MALAGRPSRRRGTSQRWLVVPFVVTIAVFLVDASMRARSPQPQRILTEQAWIDRVLPSITQSSAEGLRIVQLRASSPTPTRGGSAPLVAGYKSVAKDAANTARAVADEVPSKAMAKAAAFLDASLSARSDGAAALASGVSAAVSGGSLSSAAASLSTAASDFAVGDRAYVLFTTALPRLGLRMPESRWLVDPAPYQQPEAGVYLQSLRSAASPTPLHQIAVDAISTTPGAISMAGNTEVLLPGSSVVVNAVVADVGNQPEANVGVTATISPASSAPTQSVQTTVNLVAGQSMAVTLPALAPPPGLPVTLTVVVQPAGQAPGGNGNSRSITIELPGTSQPAPTSTTSIGTGGSTTSTSGASNGKAG
jgi:hypothetical protein